MDAGEGREQDAEALLYLLHPFSRPGGRGNALFFADIGIHVLY